MKFLIVLLVIALCNAVNAQVAGNGCSALGIDFTPLSSYTLSYHNVASNWTYVFRMCGNVNDDSICNGDSTSRGSMVCQRRTDPNANAWALATYTPASMYYTATRRGMSMQYTGGETCGATGQPRFLQINFNCEASATTPTITFAGEDSTCRYRIEVSSNIVCRDASFCNFNGYDFLNMFGQGDLVYNTSNHAFYFHMCSATGVNNEYCRRDSSAASSMLCQMRRDGSDAFSLANWTPQQLTWSTLSGSTSTGLQIVAANGEFCGAVNASRTTRFNFVCDNSLNATYSYISGIAEVQTCVYEVTVRTLLVCTSYTASTALSWSSSSSWFADGPGSCTFSGYNLMPLYNYADLSWTGFVGNTYYNVFFHMCGTVRDANCLNDSTTYNSMICQQRYTDFTSNYALAHYLTRYTTSSLSRYGATVAIHEVGERCGGSNFGRSSVIEFVCNPTATYPGVITDVREIQTCVYTMTVQTSLVCNGTNAMPSGPSYTGTDPRSNCIHENTLDFTRLNPVDPNTDLDFFAVYPNNRTYNIYMRFCERVANRACRADTTATNSMVCQRRADGSEAFNLATYNTSYMSFVNLVDTSKTFTGVRLRVTGGEVCGTGTREITIDFRCNNTIAQRSAVIISFAEPETCKYTMEVVANDFICPFLSEKNNPGGSASSGSDGLSGGMIALIVIVIIVGIAAIIAAIAAWKFYGSPFAFMAHNKGEKDIEMQHDNGHNTSYEHEESTTGENI
jgi:hypothetical protein